MIFSNKKNIIWLYLCHTGELYRKAMILPFASSGQVLLGIPKNQILSVLSETNRTKSLLIGIAAVYGRI
ncbi:MAG: hypothetical protein A2096_14035 [Spirochaetes bacterium GWF1_41_5]|nr:MAG: hypothetical protein A2096_14035 [Spirochaetes bacterium GWF1_41_5]